MDTLIGKQFNRYCLISRLGQGSFAQVYLAEHVYLKTLVAVKILRILLSDEEIEVFLNEVRTIARLQHPHIVPICDCEIEERSPFLVTAYAPHGSLGHQYKWPCLPMDDILRYTSRTAEGVWCRVVPIERPKYDGRSEPLYNVRANELALRQSIGQLCQCLYHHLGT
jgi:eukaryotic-like serine/threonine-protein kinase